MAISNALRQQIYERDGLECLRCFRTDKLTIDHITPRSRGGSDSAENLQTLCVDCNVAYGNDDKLPEAEMKGIRRRADEEFRRSLVLTGIQLNKFYLVKQETLAALRARGGESRWIVGAPKE